ncbi:MAG: dimethyl sulfoxide reductase anchor subunit family protein [Thermoleophilia bacterium]
MGHQDRNRPLVGFTVLGPASVGALLGALVLAPEVPAPFGATAAGCAVVLAVAAALLSLAHLDKPSKAHRAVRKFPASPLSREIVVFVAYTTAAAAFAAAAVAGAAPLWLGIGSVALGAAAVIATAQVYAIPGRPAWHHWSTVAGFAGCALSLGPAFTLALAGAWWPAALAGDRALALRALTMAGVALAGTAFWARTARSNRMPAIGAAQREGAQAGTTGLWITRVVVGLLIPVAVLALSPTSALTVAMAALALLVGETADRTMFFAGAAPQPIGSEIPGAR